MEIRSQVVNDSFREGYDDVFDGETKTIESDSVELLREDLRELPGELVTKDTGDPVKIHELDDPHIVDDLKVDYDKLNSDVHLTDEDRIKRISEAVKSMLKMVNEYQVNPTTVDIVRFRICRSITASAAEAMEDGVSYEVIDAKLTERKYVWFPKNNPDLYELRYGNPPPNLKRPGHLKNIDLHIDVFNMPERILDCLRAGNIELPDSSKLMLNWKNSKPKSFLEI